MYFTEFNIKTQKINFKISYTNCVCAHGRVHTQVKNFADAPRYFFIFNFTLSVVVLLTVCLSFSTSIKKNFQVSITLTHFFSEYHLPIAFYSDYLTTDISSQHSISRIFGSVVIS